MTPKKKHGAKKLGAYAPVKAWGLYVHHTDDLISVHLTQATAYAHKQDYWYTNLVTVRRVLITQSNQRSGG